jgi:GTP cyclohydrolase II
MVTDAAALVEEVARLPFPTAFGRFELRGYRCRSSFVYLALVTGDIDGGSDVLTRIHSECLTGDVLGSLRCDCGIQLRASLRTIAAEGRGVLIYATNHEGRGIGLVNKLQAYVHQDVGLDTVDANLRLGLPIDGRDYSEAVAVLRAMGIRTVRLMTNNPEKIDAVKASGIDVTERRTMPVAAHGNNMRYLTTKRDRLGHHDPVGNRLHQATPAPTDVSQIVGRIRYKTDRPYVILKYAQTMDGRIATSSGDSKWISCEAERRVSHGVRAHCDAILVGAGTVLRDDPQLTVRLVPGASPIRVILDTTLRIPSSASVFSEDAPTIVLTGPRSDESRRRLLKQRGVRVQDVPLEDGQVHLPSALRVLREIGIRSVVVEGGARVITSFLMTRYVDRLVVSIAPKLLGRGTDAVGDLGVDLVRNGIELDSRTVHVIGDDVLIAADVLWSKQERAR